MLDQERKFLDDCAKILQSGGKFDLKQVRAMRSQIRVPAMYRKFKLDDEQMFEVERQ